MQNAKMPILDRPMALVGMMGVGKTTIGQKLAAMLDVEFVDTDKVVEDRAGMDIAAIFDAQGEEAFRDLEHQVIADVFVKCPKVIAVGGGAYCFERNCRIIDSVGISILLCSSPESIHARTAASQTRPLLKKKNSLLEIRNLLKQREKKYNQARYKFCTDNDESIAQLATSIATTVLR